MSSPFFSILLITYNRPVLIQSTLKSLAKQTFQNYELYVVDNGSSISVKNLCEEIIGPQLCYYDRRETNCRDAIELLKSVYSRLIGKYLLVLADDDGLVPSALERVENVISQTNAQTVNVGWAFFNHPELRESGTQLRFHRGTGQLIRFESRSLVETDFASWGIGRVTRRVRMPANHLSCAFINMNLVRRVITETGIMMSKPLGDIGFLAPYMRTDYAYFLDLPLAIIGTALVRDWDGTKKGNRNHWGSMKMDLKRAPLHGLSFINMAIESHLLLAEKNNFFFSDYPLTLQPSYYLHHLSEVLGDHPWNKQTLSDLKEWLNVVISLPLRQQFNMIVFVGMKGLRYVQKKIVRARLHSGELSGEIFVNGDEMGFADLATAADWLDRTQLLLPSSNFEEISSS